MAIFRWPDSFDPFSGLRVMQREMERLMSRAGIGEGQRIGGGNFPPVNVFDAADELVVQCELAGIQREDVDLSITGETLVIRGNRKPCADEGEVRYQRRERGCGEFSRTIVLPDPVEHNKVEATLDAGILSIRLPKSEASKPKQIPIR
jgi:HSP20 family protein